MKKKFSKIWGVGLAVALLVSLMVAAVPASALSQPTVTFPFDPVNPNDVISRVNADYNINFTVGREIGTGFTTNATITISFPADTVITPASINSTSCTIAASPGWVMVGGTPKWTSANLTSTNWTAAYDALAGIRKVMYTLKPGDVIGESAQVRIGITAGITNPTAPGSYKLSVTIAVGTQPPAEGPTESAAYTINPPYIGPLGGLVELYNPAGVLMKRDVGHAAIQSVLAYAGKGYTVKVAPGTYDMPLTVGAAEVTLVATGTVADTVITGTIGITNQDKVTIQGFTITGAITANNATSALIKDCVLKPVVFPVPGPATLLTVSTITDMLKPLTVSGGSIAVTGTATTKGIDVTNAYVTVTGCTLTVDVDGFAVVANAGGSVTLTSSPVTGSSGTGVKVDKGSATITKSALKTLTTAVYVTGNATVKGSVTVKESSIEGCGSATYGLGDAIIVSGNSTATLYSNTIKDSAAANYALSVSAGTVKAWFNNITGNAKNVNTAVVLDLRHNWWGATTGPAPGSIAGAGALLTKTSPVSGASISLAAAAFPPFVGLDASTTVGVAVTGLKANVVEMLDYVAVAKYAANPQIAAPAIAGVGSVLGYYDVFYYDAGADTLQIKFYGAISPYTKVYYGGGISGLWAEPKTAAGAPAWGVNVAGGYLYVTITGSTTPSLTDLTGTPFALVEDKTTAPPTLEAPDLGADNVKLAPTFVWAVVPGAIRYEFALSEDSAFKILKWSANVPVNMYAAPEELKYSTTYYWRVRGVLAEPYLVGPTWVTPATPWATGIFTTAAEPVEAVTEVTVPAPKVDVTVEPAKITVEPAAPAIPDYMLWIIIGVGAVLVIALIVLIVRTRRVA